MMMVPLFLLLVITLTTLPPSIYGIVPPKTPVLSGFGPAAIGSYREMVCDASQPDTGTITYKWFKYSTGTGSAENWERKGPIGTSQKYVFNMVTEKKLFHQGGSGNTDPVSGKYKCRASNSAGTRDSEWGDLYVYKPCSLYTVSVSPARPAIGSTFTLNCYITNPSGFTVNWLKKTDASPAASVAAIANSKGCHAPTFDARYSWKSCSPPSNSTPTKTFNLQVTNAQPADFAYWICKDIGLSCDGNPVKPVVQAPPGTPDITGFPSGPVINGTLVNLICNASPAGDTYEWYKDGTSVSKSSSYDFQATKDSAGVYRCNATNGAGSSVSKRTLVVYYKPDSVVVSSGKTSSYVGEKDKFTCTVTGGYPTPNVTIYFKRSGGIPVEVTQGQERVMAKGDNQAEYYCEAKVAEYPTLNMTSSRKTYNVTSQTSASSAVVEGTGRSSGGRNGSSPVGAIAGAVGGFIFLLIIIAVVLAVVFIRKKRRVEKEARNLTLSNNNGDANGGQVNPGFSDPDARHSDVTDVSGFNPNEHDDMVEMTSSPSSSTGIQIKATGGAEYAVVNKKGSKKPPVGEAYAEVDFKKKKAGKKKSAPPAPGGQAYAEVDFSKKSKKGKAPVPPTGQGDVYATVNKPKKTKPGKSRAGDQTVPANVPSIEDVHKEEPTENGYRQPKEAYQVGVDGTLYSQVQISKPKDPDVVRGKEAIEEPYASVDFSLQAPPLPEPQDAEDPDDPEDPSFMVWL